MKVVLDTNVLISAFLWKGPPKKIFLLAKKKKIRICVTKEILREFEKVLSYPKLQKRLFLIKKSPQEIMYELIEIVDYFPSLKFLAPRIPKDPSDEKFLACALVARAEYIISGDKHILSLRKFFDIPIVSPRQFFTNSRGPGAY